MHQPLDWLVQVSGLVDEFVALSKGCFGLLKLGAAQSREEQVNK